MASAALERLTQPQLAGYWLHLDIDVLAPTVMPAVDSPDPGGLDWPDLEALLGPLLAHPAALGLQITMFDPNLDPDGHLEGLQTSSSMCCGGCERVSADACERLL